MKERLRDREEAGRLLAKKLAKYSGQPDVLVLGLARGGVPVAREVAQSLRAPLDVLMVRKLRVPGFDDFSMGAISIGGAQSINPDVVEEFHLSKAEIDKVMRAERKEMDRLDQIYREQRPPLEVRNRTVILVDDGMTTGATMRAAIAAIRRLGANRVVVAAGAAPLSTYLLLVPEADEVVCAMTPREVRSIDLFYEVFPLLTDNDVRAFLKQAGRPNRRSARFGR